MDNLDQLNATLQVIANCLAFLAVQSDEMRGKSTKEKIIFLSNVGIDDPSAIAAIANSTEGNVRKEISLARKTE